MYEEYCETLSEIMCTKVPDVCPGPVSESILNSNCFLDQQTYSRKIPSKGS